MRHSSRHQQQKACSDQVTGCAPRLTCVTVALNKGQVLSEALLRVCEHKGAHQVSRVNLGAEQLCVSSSCIAEVSCEC